MSMLRCLHFDSYHRADLQAQYEVRLEQGLDTFVVVDGLPVVEEDKRQKLIKFLLKRLNTVGKTKEDAVHMPLNEKNMTEGYGQMKLPDLVLCSRS